MADKYRDENVDTFMDVLERELTAMVGKEFGNLGVAGVLERNRQDNPEMTLEDATMWAMRDTAARVLRKTKVLATTLDRMVAMVGNMADEMGADGNQNSERYRKRLEVLLELDKNYRKLM
jgi:hypothetical protein